MLDIFVDGDACPVREEVARLAQSRGLRLYLVSNQGLRRAMGPHVTPILAGSEFDAADNWIAGHIGTGDIAVTADIQLAARCLRKGAVAMGPNGHIFTPENIGSALAMRELNAHLRQTGESKGYNAVFSKNDRSQFLQSMDRVILKLQRGAGAAGP